MNDSDLESILQQEHEQDLELIRGKLISETAKMPWTDLQRFFANGSTLYVSPELDLIDVAFAFQRDLADQVKPWLDQALVATVSTEQAKAWFEQDSLLWTVVVKPWVLIQLPK
ncbi:MAG: hypothetical protein ACJA0I_001559 [Gammaproteobacteria bacterium]|jgi:hypothetical protein